MFESLVNTPFKIPFVSTNNVTGLSSFSNVHLLKDGVAVSTPTITYTEIGNGLYVATYTPTATGVYSLFIESKIQGTVNVLAKTSLTFLQNLEDEALGSWAWNKTTGVLTFTRQSGTTLAGFSVVDDLATASRQRTSP